jgi:hypothetical protein
MVFDSAIDVPGGLAWLISAIPQLWSEPSDLTTRRRNRHVIRQRKTDRRDRRDGSAGRRSCTCRARQRPIQGRALSRNPDKHRELADEVVEADLNRPETLKAAFRGAHGVFLITNFREQGTDELKQAAATPRCQGCWRQTLYLVNAA